MKNPVVGITSFCDCEHSKKYTKIRCSYINAVYRAGGTPIIIPPFDTQKHLQEYIDLIDALVLSGGEDLAPASYGETKVFELKNINPDRDKWEIALFKEAYKAQIPILGICRGMQLINVSLGGSLYQDIDHQLDCGFSHLPLDLEKRENREYVNHKINIIKDTQLDKILSEDDLTVNSHHHQAIKEIAQSLNISAKSECGLIEAIENKKGSFLMGLQWHPEDLIDNSRSFINLFSELIKVAKTRKDNSCAKK
ncbi:MAG: gamma-glutamyl-gamma-aminobutyrate hydrolase family protein [Bacillota bacterium]